MYILFTDKINLQKRSCSFSEMTQSSGAHTSQPYNTVGRTIALNGCNCTQSTVLPVPTRHRRHACIKMRTAIPANTQTRPNVVSMLVQRRWRWANIETASGQMLAFAGLHTGVCLHPPLRHHNILASRSGYF